MLRAAAPSASFEFGAQAWNGVNGRLYNYDTLSLLPDDGVNVIKPNDVPALNPGRWILVPTAGSPPVPAPTSFSLDGGEYSTIDLSDIIVGFPGAYVGSPVAVSTARTLAGCYLIRRSAGAGGTTRLDVLKNGLSIFALLADQPVVPAVNYATDFKPPTVPGAANWLANDVAEVVQRTTETFQANVGFPDGPSGWSLELRWA